MRPVHKPKNFQLAFLLLLIALVIALMMSLRQCFRESPDTPLQPAEGTPSDTLRVAIAYAPMSYYIYDDTVGGMNYDLLQRMSRDLKIPVSITPIVSLAASMEDLRHKRVDLIASLAADTRLQKEFILSQPLFLDRQVLVQSSSDPGRAVSSLDLAGDTVHIAKDSPAAARLQNLQEEIGQEFTVVPHGDLSEEYLVMKVASGELRKAVVNEQIAKRIKLDFPSIDYSTPVSFTQFQSWLALKSDSARIRRINQWILEFKESPDYQSLLKRYHIQ